MQPLTEPVELVVDGRTVPLSPFVRRVLSSTMRGLVETLNGVDNPASVELRLGPEATGDGEPRVACGGKQLI